MTIDAQRLDTIEKNAITVIGVPYDENSTYMQGAAGGPPKIREALHCGSANLCSEDGVDLGVQTLFNDLGDMEFAQSSAPLDAIQQFVGKLLEKEARVLVLGGDHAITPAVLRAYHEKFGRINVLHFDAHPDLYESFEGNRDSHACPFARIMEEKLAKRLVQVGIRTMNPHQQNQAEKFGVEVVDMQSWRPGMRFDFSGPLYISLDMDALDPAFAPGVSHHEPGGLSTRDLLTMIQAIDVPVIGADIVEFNPLRDVSGMTAMVAAKLMKELASKMLND
ncbi:MAG: agmatinase [Deltaproteobacteria bacterium]|nr:agmatinase [Deltaproteobacteria bacterium]